VLHTKSAELLDPEKRRKSSGGIDGTAFRIQHKSLLSSHRKTVVRQLAIVPSAKVLPRNNNDLNCTQIAMEEEDDNYASEGIYGGSNYAESRLGYLQYRRDSKEVAEATTSPNLRGSNPIVTLLGECSSQRSPDYTGMRQSSVKGQ